MTQLIDFATPPRRILVCQLRQIGDVLLATPALELLKKRFPDADIDVLTEKKCVPVLENHPLIRRIHAIDKKVLTHLGKEVLFYLRVAREKYDIVIDFQQLPRCRWVVAFSRAPVRLSHEAPWYNRWLYTHMVTPEGGYAAKTKASVLCPLGIAWDGERPLLRLADEEMEAGRAILRDLCVDPAEHVLITLDPTHRRATRRWPYEHYGELIRLAAERHPDWRFVPMFGPGEMELVHKIYAAAGRPDTCRVPGEVMPLRHMAAVIALARMHVGNCSAPRHIAVSVNTPTLGIMGSTGNAWTFPAPEHATVSNDIPCRPCNKNECPNPPETHRACLTNLEPETVLQAMEAHMERTE